VPGGKGKGDGGNEARAGLVGWEISLGNFATANGWGWVGGVGFSKLIDPLSFRTISFVYKLHDPFNFLSFQYIF
jgi:hypothetical protein